MICLQGKNQLKIKVKQQQAVKSVSAFPLATAFYVIIRKALQVSV